MFFVRCISITIILVVEMCFKSLFAENLSDDSVSERNVILRNYFDAQSGTLPFSFNYKNIPFADLYQKWETQQHVEILDNDRTKTSLTWKDPTTNLLVRCEITEYHDFPTIEWIVYLKNTGQSETPIIKDIQGLDITLGPVPSGKFVLHHARGSFSHITDYEPLTTNLGPGTHLHLAPVGGRGSNGIWPYFNLEWEGTGRIIAVGWPGQWAADFNRNGQSGLCLRAGQELTHLKLMPGEQIRTPLIVVQSYQGIDWLQAQNVWRRWMMAYGMPRPGNKLPKPMLLACSFRTYFEMTKADEASQKMFIDRYLEEGLKIDYWWMDAGWYPLLNGDWGDVGTWEVDPTRFPHGLGPISDFAHASDFSLLLDRE